MAAQTVEGFTCMHRAEYLRGILSEKLNTAAWEIYVVLEKTVAAYEAEAAGLRQEIDQQKSQLGILLQLKLEALDGQYPVTEPTSVAEGTNIEAEGRSNETEQTAEEVQVKHEQSLECEEDINDFSDIQMDDREVGLGQYLFEYEDEIPTSSWAGGCRIPDQTNQVNLKICIVKNPTAVRITPNLYKKFPPQELKCPCGQQEADFMNLLKFTFPLLAVENTFDILVCKNKKLSPPDIERLTPEGLHRAGHSMIYVRLKKPESKPEEQQSSSEEENESFPADESLPEQELNHLNTSNEKIPPARYSPRCFSPQYQYSKKKPQELRRISSKLPIALNIRVRLFSSIVNMQMRLANRTTTLMCPPTMKWKQFLRLLRSTYPELPAEEPLEFYSTHRGRKFKKLLVENMTPQEIFSLTGSRTIYVRPKGFEKKTKKLENQESPLSADAAPSPSSDACRPLPSPAAAAVPPSLANPSLFADGGAPPSLAAFCPQPPPAASPSPRASPLPSPASPPPSEAISSPLPPPAPLISPSSTAAPDPVSTDQTSLNLSPLLSTIQSDRKMLQKPQSLSLKLPINLNVSILPDFSNPTVLTNAAPAARGTGGHKRRASHFLPGAMKRSYKTEEANNKIMAQNPKRDPEQNSATSDSDNDTGGEDEEHLLCAGSSSTSSTDYSDENEEETPSDMKWRSRNREILWAPTNSMTFPYDPPDTGITAGPTSYAAVRVGELIDSFDIFFTPEITKMITKYTNEHGRRKVTGWNDLDAITVRAYFGLLLLAGVYRSHGESNRSLWDEHAGRHIFQATMSLRTFTLINSILRFDDQVSRRRHRREDKLAAIRKIWDLWTAQLPLMFNPGVDVCVDKQLVPYRGQCKFRQYIHKKPGRYGLKMWVTCDVKTSYAWRVSVYTGREAGTSTGCNQEQRVMLDMTEGLTGVTVTCDHFFSSYELAEELLKREITMVGTMRRKQPELPPQLFRLRDRETLSSVFGFSQTHTVVSYIPKQGKNIILLSTKHRAPKIINRQKRKPQILLDYNCCKGGVDALDEMISTYSCRRMTRRWPLALFFYMLDISALNAYIVWNALDPAWQRGKPYRRRMFLEELGKKLVTPQMVRRPSLPKTPGAASLVLEAKAGSSNPTTESGTSSRNTTPSLRRQCVLCTLRRPVSCKCAKCGAHVCREHYKAVCNSCYG